MRPILFAILFLSFSAQSAWLVKQRVDESGKVISVEAYKKIEKQVSEKIILKDIVEHIGEKSPTNLNIRYQEILLPDSESMPVLRNSKAVNLDIPVQWRDSEVRTIVSQGDPKNRIDLTIVGDGYTLAEKERFFEDAQRITEDMFTGQTFASYLALFNVHAVFVPSRESGITDAVKKDTALGLYRNPVGSKRAIMPGNTSTIERAIALAPDSDYPILIANDEFYGGLGGRYAISTRSLGSGTIVLRHELGHNFGNVGEEYDGGFVYSGANASRSANVSWSHWIEGSTQVYDSKFLAGDYVWKNLSTGSYKSTFQFPSAGYIFDLIISSVGWSTENDIEVSLDGVTKEISGKYTEDRSFFKFKNPENLTSGSHTLEIKENVKDNDNVLAFAMIYAHPQNINMNKGFTGAYSTFNSSGAKAAYRPTFDSCLMRDMSSVNFCSVDQENMWIRFFNVVGLIDSLTLDQQNNQKIVRVKTLDLSELDIKWYGKKSGGSFELIGSTTKDISGFSTDYRTIKVVVEFKTPEVRKPGAQFVSQKEISL